MTQETQKTTAAEGQQFARLDSQEASTYNAAHHHEGKVVKAQYATGKNTGHCLPQNEGRSMSSDSEQAKNSENDGAEINEQSGTMQIAAELSRWRW